MLGLWIVPTAAVAAASAAHPWESFPSSPAAGAAAGVRRYSHSEHTSLQDGSGVLVSWDVDVDPESILALDWERQQHNGVALVSCTRDRLTLHVPQEHTVRLPRWQFVTFSSDLHGCQHLAGRDLYHKVLRVAERSSAGPSEKVTLATQELLKASEVFHRCSYNLTLTPPPVGGRRLTDSRKLKDEHHAWNKSFAPPMPFELPFNHSIPRFASESFMLHARRLVLKAGAELHYSSTKNKDGHVHMEDFWGKVDFDVDIDADIIVHLKVASPDADKGIPAVTETQMFDPVALCEKIKVPLGPVPLTILPQIDALRLKVKRIGRLEGSFNALLNAKVVGFILLQFNEQSGMHVRVNSTVVKGVVKPPVFILIDDDFSLDASLVANVSVQPFFMVGMNPKFGISVGLAPGKKCAYRELDVHANASLDFEVTSPLNLGQFSRNLPRRGIWGLLGDILPEKVCNKGFCNGTRPGCHNSEVSLTIDIPTIVIVTNRTLKKEAVPTGLRDAIGYGLSGFPDEVRVMRAFFLNQTGHKQRKEFRHTVGEPLGEAVHKLGTVFLHQFSMGLSAQPQQGHARRLTDGGDSEEVDAFVVQLTKTRFEITDEVLQRLLDLGAFRIYDGRESSLSGIRITSIGLLPRESGQQQQLWEEAPVGTPEERGGTSIALVTSTLAALALVGLAGACMRRKPRQYGLVMAEDAA